MDRLKQSQRVMRKQYEAISRREASASEREESLRARRSTKHRRVAIALVLLGIFVPISALPFTAIDREANVHGATRGDDREFIETRNIHISDEPLVGYSKIVVLGIILVASGGTAYLFDVLRDHPDA